MALARPNPVGAPDPERRAAPRGPAVLELVLLAAQQDRVAPAGPVMRRDRAAAARAAKEVPPVRVPAAPVATPVV
jgi:hypothetical protein